ELVLHVQRPEHLAHLARAEARAREGLALQGSSLDALVRALRDRAVSARNDDERQLSRDDAPLGLCPLSDRRQGARVVPRLVDDSLYASRERLPRRQP